MTPYDDQRIDQADVESTIRTFADNEALKRHRDDLARFTARIFADVGEKLHVVATSHRDSKSGYATNDVSDETTTVSMLLRVAAQLVSACNDLFSDDRNYAAAALLRQMVEVEYLAWAVDVRDQDGKRWLRSDRKQRMSFFSPVKLRKAAKGNFRSQDYSFHCDCGGHPTPVGAAMLLDGDQAGAQVLLTDLLGHAGRMWDHVVRWGKRSPHGGPILDHSQQMLARFSAWKIQDPLTKLPPSPELRL